MSVWIELMCDVRRKGCLSDKADNIGGLARTPTASQAVVRQLTKEARKQGWIIAYGKIVCPGCRA